MSRFRFFLFCIFCFPLVSLGQKKDFFPDRIDNLVPQYYDNIFSDESFPLDSSYLVRKDARTRLTIREQNTSELDTLFAIYYFQWNKQGRLISYRKYLKDEIHSQRNYKKMEQFSLDVSDTFIYANGKLLIEMDRNRQNGIYNTLKLSYNRIGKISSEYFHSFYNNSENKKDSVMRFLYNSKGQLIVVQNFKMRSGELHYGNCFFNYDDGGKLCSRNFMDGTDGKSLMRDTLVYQYTDSLKTILQTRHYYKTQEHSQWTFADEKTVNDITGAVLSRKAKMEVVNQYDGDGKRKLEIIEDTLQRQTVYVTFSYGKGAIPDTINSSFFDNSDGKKLISKNTILIYYDVAGLDLRVESYEEDRDRKRINVMTQIFEWK
jgi:hypothetical protein